MTISPKRENELAEVQVVRTYYAYPLKFQIDLCFNNQGFPRQFGMKSIRATTLPGGLSGENILGCYIREILLDRKINLEASEEIFKAACEKYGESEVRYDSYTQKGGGLDFPVLSRDGRIMSSLSMSETLERMPVVAIEYVYISPSLRKKPIPGSIKIEIK